MAFRLKSLRKNKFGTSNGVMLIFIPFFITILLTVVYIPIDAPMGAEDLVMYTPDHYRDMSPQERDNWLLDTHGNWTLELRTWMGIPHTILTDWAGTWWLVFDDGFEMKQSDWQKWRLGQDIDPDYVALTLSVLTIDPLALRELDVYGGIIRIVMIVSVCIGLVDIIWFG